jgi:hypothetical protein
VWQSCGVSVLPPTGGGFGCDAAGDAGKCRDAESCIWGARRAAFVAVRQAVKSAMGTLNSTGAVLLKGGLVSEQEAVDWMTM